MDATISSATITSGSATYSGPVDVTFEPDASGTYYEGPDGTHGTSSTCNNATGTPWGVVATISGINTEGSTVDCTFEGTYSRVDLAMTWDLTSGECDIAEGGLDGSDVVTNDPTTDEWSATLGECVDSPNPNVPTECEVTDLSISV